jgi:four helix bundle protein
MGKEPIRDYRDLLAWQKAIDLALANEDVCDAIPRKSAYLTHQMRRAANSIHSNIAEGNGRFSIPDYLRHLSMSNASLKELESDLYFVVRRYGKTPAIERALDLALVVTKLLAGLVKSLRRKGREE